MYLFFSSNDKVDSEVNKSITLSNSMETLTLVEIDQLQDGIHTGFEVIDSVGDLSQNGFTVLTNIPITNDGRAIFESRFLKRSHLIEQEPGFLAIRILRPIASNTYIIMTLWEKESDFKLWQESEAYAHQHRHRGTSEGIAEQHGNIFAGAPFIKTYHIANM